MALSDRKLEKKEHHHKLFSEEAMPRYTHTEEALPDMTTVLLDMMGEYLDDDIQVSSSPYVNGLKLTIFGKDVAGHIYRKALSIARDLVLPAAPLDQLDVAIKQNPNVLLPTIEINGIKGTLLQLAIIRLDQTITSESGVENKGMAEMLMDSHAKYLPDTVPEAIVKARLASFLEEDEKERETKQVEVLNKAFDAIKKNEPFAGRIVEDYIKSTKPEPITNRCYYLGLLQLHCRAFDLLARRGGDLNGSWYGAQGDRFCIEVIGGAIQKELPDWIRQIVINGTYHILQERRIVKRWIDPAGRAFLNQLNSKQLLGVNFFYDIFDWAHGLRVYSCSRERGMEIFSKLISSNYISNQNLCSYQFQHAIVGQVSDTVGARSISAASAAGR